MRHTSMAAAFLAAAVIGGVVAVPAHAQANAGGVARAVWIKSCYNKKDETSYPCGKWQLIMADGSKRTVPDAATRSLDASRAVSGEEASFAISGDGRWMVYERAKDHRMVVRKVSGGPVTELPKSVVPKGIGTEDMALYLTGTGDKVLIDYDDAGESEPGKVVTVATGAIVNLRAKDDLQGFSADGDEVLALRYGKDNTTAVVAHRLDGTSIKKTPPQVVVSATTRALAADGRTLAVFVSGNVDKKQAPRLRLYDLETGELSPAVDLALKPGDTPYLAEWSGEGELVAKVSSGGDGTPTVVRVFTVDAASGAVSRQDRYSISKTNYTWFAAGE